MHTASLKTLVTGLIDYAGLYPPASLSMQAAVENYARDRAGVHAWMLGRFVCPTSRLREFSKAAAPLMPGTYATEGYREMADIGEPWRISAICDSQGIEGLEKDLETIQGFNDHHGSEDHGLALIDCVEVKAATPDFIDEAIDLIHDDLFPFFEVPAVEDCRGFIAALPGHVAAAKVRTGGIVADAFPDSRRIAEFIHACVLADVPFKATAGLHHPVRGEHKLTYDAGAKSCVMHGFLNVFVAAVLVHARKSELAQTTQILEETDPKAFVFSEEGLRWKQLLADDTTIARAREAFALSFGSCSFDEPVADLQAAGLL